jgi:hypothetical protein
MHHHTSAPVEVLTANSRVRVDGVRFERRFCILHPHGTPSIASAHLMDALKQSAERLEASAAAHMPATRA